MSNENNKPAASASPATGVVLHGNRSREVPLEYPAEFGGVTYEKVTIRRMSAAEVASFLVVLHNPTSDTSHVPTQMLDIPAEVFFELDPDDRETIEENILDFLPRSLQTAAVLAQASGEATSPPSQASSEAESTSTSE